MGGRPAKPPAKNYVRSVIRPYMHWCSESRSLPRTAGPLQADTTVRLRDVAGLQGTAPVPLIGYGLVVGLNKTGDRRQTIFSAQTLANMLERFGVLVPGEQIKIENVAAVLVTAELPAFVAAGQPARHHRVVDRRCAQPAGRHAAADAAARHRRQSTRWRRARCRSADSAAARAATPCR